MSYTPTNFPPLEEIIAFIEEAGANTYAGGGKYLEVTERQDHKELEYRKGDFYYKDSYCGFYRSRGSEYVMYKERIIWENGYGGGMIAGKEELAEECFTFLKKVMLRKAEEPTFNSFRGPKAFTDGAWEYSYEQIGNLKNFTGHEEIKYKGELVFWHDITGGLVEWN